MLSVAATVSGSATFKILGVSPTLCRAGKLNVCFMAHVYDTQPDTLIANILSYATEGRGSAKRKTWIKTDERNTYWFKIKDIVASGEYRRARSNRQWGEEMQVSTGSTGKRRVWNASKIRNMAPRMGTFLTQKRKICRGELLREVCSTEAWLHLRTTVSVLGCPKYTKATRSCLVRCSGIEAAVKGLYRGLK